MLTTDTSNALHAVDMPACCAHEYVLLHLKFPLILYALLVVHNGQGAFHTKKHFDATALYVQGWHIPDQGTQTGPWLTWM